MGTALERFSAARGYVGDYLVCPQCGTPHAPSASFIKKGHGRLTSMWRSWLGSSTRRAPISRSRTCCRLRTGSERRSAGSRIGLPSSGPRTLSLSAGCLREQGSRQNSALLNALMPRLSRPSLNTGCSPLDTQLVECARPCLRSIDVHAASEPMLLAQFCSFRMHRRARMASWSGVDTATGGLDGGARAVTAKALATRFWRVLRCAVFLCVWLSSSCR